MNTRIASPVSGDNAIAERCRHDMPLRNCGRCLSVPYIVDYFNAEGVAKSVEVIAVDAIDAKHLAEAASGEVIVSATARKVR